MNVCLYARVACPDQVKLDCQVEQLKEFACKQDMEIIAVEAEFGSGLHTNRPALSRVESLSADGKIDAVVIADISRLFRNTSFYLEFERHLESYGVKIITLNGDLKFMNLLHCIDNCLKS